MEKTIAVDFDGVIHAYTRGWQGGVIYDDPVPGAFDSLYKLMNEGFKVVILTTRSNHNDIREWMVKHNFSYGTEIHITGVKVPAVAYIDDRAVRFTNWNDIRKLFC